VDLGSKILLWILIFIRLLIAVGLIYVVVIEFKRLKSKDKEDGK